MWGKIWEYFVQNEWLFTIKYHAEQNKAQNYCKNDKYSTNKNLLWKIGIFPENRKK